MKTLKNLDPELLDISTWPGIDITLVPQKYADLVQRRKTAIELCMQRASRARIAELTKLDRHEVHRILSRCLETHPDGRIWGFRGILPHKRVASSKIRIGKNGRAQGGTSGALGRLFFEHPEIRAALEERVLHDSRKCPEAHREKRTRIIDIWIYFLMLCREVGIASNEYPFSVEYRGKRSINRFVRRLKEAHFERFVSAQESADAETNLGTGRGVVCSEPITRPYQQVAIDGHKIDAIIVIRVELENGKSQVVEVHRIWLLVLRDSASRACLGYHLSLNREYTAEDVLECVINALRPHKKMEFKTPGLSCPKGGGFPSETFAQCEWACWDEMLLDNARANLADRVRKRLTELVGSAVRVGPPATPSRRAVIERFFGLLAHAGYQRLPSTTGSHPHDAKKSDASGKARRFELTFRDLRELTEVLLAEINGAPTEGILYRSPIEYIEHHLNGGQQIRTLPAGMRDKFSLSALRIRAQVCGDVKNGRRPYVNYQSVRYSSELLANSPCMIGTTFVLAVDTNDLRILKAYAENGEEVGVLQASNWWGLVPHDLTTRRAIMRMRKRREIYFAEHDNPIEIFRSEMARRALRGRKEAGAFQRLEYTSPANQEAKPTPLAKSQIPPMDPGTTRKAGLKGLNH